MGQQVFSRLYLRLPIPMIRAAAETTEKLMSEPDSPVLGLHLEGHYFNMKMAGDRCRKI